MGAEMTITEIIRKLRSKSIFLVYLDGKFWTEMLDETVVKFDLKTGKDLDEKTAEEILTSSKPPLAMHLCLNLLDRSSKTKKEIFDYDEVNTRHVPEEKEEDEDYDYEEDDEDEEIED